MRLEWEEKAACRGAPTETFFPEINGDKTDNPWIPARNYCGQCTVKKQCLDAALKYEQPILMRFGMWGGQTPAERSVTASKRTKKTYNL